jgi:hypothetical protein
VPPAARFESEHASVPRDVFVVHELEFRGDVVHFQGTQGPVPKNIGMPCGETWTITLRSRNDGWVIGKITGFMC